MREAVESFVAGVVTEHIPRPNASTFQKTKTANPMQKKRATSPCRRMRRDIDQMNQTERNQQLFDRARAVIPGGVIASRRCSAPPVSRMPGCPDGKLTTPRSRQKTPLRKPVPSALAAASLAAKRRA